jgi:ribose transport system permease protein
MNAGGRLTEFFERYALLGLLLLVGVFFSLNPSTSEFDSSANITAILSNQSILGILAIATVIPLVTGQIDLSVGPNAGLTSVLCAGLMSKSGWPLPAAVLAAIVVGAVIGIVNGILVAGFRIPSIIATLGMTSVIAAIVQAYSGGLSITTGISPVLINLGSGNWLGLPKLFYFMVGAGLVAWYFLEKTPLGKSLYALGSSPRAALLVGIRVPRLTFRSFVIAGALAGGTGILVIANVGSGNPELGPNYTLPAIAAAFLGATAIQPGRYNVWGTITAVFFLAESVNGLTLWGASPWLSELFDGAALIIGVGLGIYAGTVRRRAAGRGQEEAHRPDSGSPPTADSPPTAAPDVAAADGGEAKSR